MKFVKYIFCLILLFAVMLQSCGLVVINGGSSDTDSADTLQTEISPDESEQEEEKPTVDWGKVKDEAYASLNRLPSYSYENENLTILTTDATFFSGDGEQTVLNSDRIARIETLEEKYSFTARVKTTSKETVFDEISANENSGIISAHIYALPTDITALLASEGYLRSLRSSQYFDGDSDVFNSATEAFTAGHNVYATSGDGCFEPEKISALYYNKAKLSELNTVSIASLVESGEWTLDKYHEYTLSAINAGFDGVPSANVFNAEYEDILLLSSGFNFCRNEADESIRLESFTDAFRTLCESIGTITADIEVSVGDSMREEFKNGNVLFLTDSVANTDLYTTMADAWSIAPHPKMDGCDGYSSFVSIDAIVLSIPSGIASPDGLGLIITAFNSISKDHIKGRYIEHNMNYIVRDIGALDALDIIINNVNYDFAYIFSSPYPNMQKFSIGAYKKLLSKEITFEEYVSSSQLPSQEYFDYFFPITHY